MARRAHSCLVPQRAIGDVAASRGTPQALGYTPPVKRQPVKTIDEYIARAAPEAQPILRRIRATIKKAVPEASETISYQIPAFQLRRIVVYFAAFKHHIGLYPPVKGDAALRKAIAPYANEKGILRFALDRTVPLALIARIAKSRAVQAGAPTTAPRPSRRPSTGLKTNKRWHARHRMPLRATLDQRLAWHLAHAKACACRSIPASVRREMRARGIAPRS